MRGTRPVPSGILSAIPPEGILNQTIAGVTDILGGEPGAITATARVA
jgi:hypothetical protein